MDISKCNGSTLVQDQDWINYWDTGTGCYQAYYDQLYSLGGRTRLDLAQLAIVQTDLKQIFDRYRRHYKLVEPGQTGYNPFLEVLYKFCTKLPGACDLALTGTGGVCTGLTRDQIASNRVLLKFCGCVAPPPTDPNVQAPSPECDALCSRADTIKIVDTDPLSPTYGLSKDCQSDICIIDQISIAATNAQIKGGLGFAQVCNTCKTGSCKCIISTPDIKATASDLGIDTRFIQVCGAQSQCFLLDPQHPEQSGTPVPCIATINQVTPPTVDSSVPSWVVWLLVAIGIIVVLLVLIYVFSLRRRTLIDLTK